LKEIESLANELKEYKLLGKLQDAKDYFMNEESCGKPQGIINHITTLLPKVTLWQATGNSQVKRVVIEYFDEDLIKARRLGINNKQSRY
jgi:hypothetical protein